MPKINDKKQNTLNHQQRMAVNHVNGPAMVIAGAGTGKTSVITHRIARLIQKKIASPDEILALTFTDKAANEMEYRLDRLLPYGVVSTNIMTFHSLGEQILRNHGVEIGIDPDYLVMSDFSQEVFLQRLIASYPLKYFRPPHNPFSFIKDLLQHFSRLKDENITYQQYKNHCKKVYKNLKTTPEKHDKEKYLEIAKLYEVYVTQTHKQSRLDFGDLIQLPIKLFEQKPNITKHYQKLYKYILVDEYQDTNTAQNLLLIKLCAHYRNIMVVGDDDQSIYRFRGAVIENILSFTKHFPDAKQIVLRKNYRSTRQILDASYKLIQNNNPYRLEVTNKISKQLQSDKNGSAVNILQATSLAEEMRLVTEQVVKLTKENVEPKQIAILVRKNMQIKSVTPYLARAGISYNTSQSTSLMQLPEIKIITNFIRFMSDQHDSVALFSLLVSEMFDLDVIKISQLSANAKKSHDHLIDVAFDSKIDKLDETLNYLESYRDKVHSYAVGEIVYEFLSSSGYLERLTKNAEKSNEAVAQIQNIAKFFSFFKEFEIASTDTDLLTFRLYLDEIRANEINIFSQESPIDDNVVNITTIHKAKGLEYDYVFMIDMTHLTFPAKKMSIRLALPKNLLVEPPDYDWHMAEERRLCYVAFTRAKTELTLSMSFDHGGKKLKKPSAFIFEATGKELVQMEQLIKNTALEQINWHKKQPQLPINQLSLIESDGWLHLSTNKIADYIRNPKEFWIYHILNLPSGTAHNLVYGSAIHAAIEQYYRARINHEPISLAQINDKFNSVWKLEGFVSRVHQMQRKQQGYKTLKQFYYKQNKSNEIPVSVEQPFLLTIDKLKVKISGRYDAIFENEDGSVEIRDFKTSNVADMAAAKNKLKGNVQLPIYAYAWDKINKPKVSAISLHFVENDIIISNKQIDHSQTYNLIKGVVEGIRAYNFNDNRSGKANLDNLL